MKPSNDTLLAIGSASSIIGCIIGFLGIWLWPVHESTSSVFPAMTGFWGLSLKVNLLITVSLIGLFGSLLIKIKFWLASIPVLVGGIGGLLLFEALWLPVGIVLVACGGYMIFSKEEIYT